MEIISSVQTFVNSLFESSGLFAITLTVGVYLIGLYIYRKTKFLFFNPLILSLLMIGLILIVFKIPYEEYNNGGSIITMLLGPATILLAVPVYDRIEMLKANVAVILVSIALGATTAVLSTWALAKLFGFDQVLTMSIIPKSTTMAIALEISNNLGGIKAITVISVLFSGLFGAVLGPSICKWIGIKNKIAMGLSIGTVSHVLGTSRAIELDKDGGAASSIAASVAGVITVVLVPLLINIITM